MSAGLPALLWGPAGHAKTPLTRGHRTLCLQTGLGDQLAGVLSPQGPQGSGSLVTGLRPGLEERGYLSALQEGDAARGKNDDEVNVSYVQLSTDRRSVSGLREGKSSICKMAGFLFNFC